MSRTPDSTEAADLETSRKKIATGAQQGICGWFYRNGSLFREFRVLRNDLLNANYRILSLCLLINLRWFLLDDLRHVPALPPILFPTLLKLVNLRLSLFPHLRPATRVLSTAEVFSLMDSFLADHPDARQLFAQHYQVPTLPPAQGRRP